MPVAPAVASKDGTIMIAGGRVKTGLAAWPAIVLALIATPAGSIEFL